MQFPQALPLSILLTVAAPAFSQGVERCLTPTRAQHVPIATESIGDCTLSSSTPNSIYDPVEVWVIPVVFHVIENTGGQGQISDAQLQTQIDILNEDFRALGGTPGSPGVDTAIQFELATTDPLGNPTTGVTRSINNTWFNDSGSYWTTLKWDTNRYLNIYTNSASGALGYVPALPQSGIAGSSSDRVVVLWDTVGRNAPFGSPYNQGRTVTHEVGHYLGLFHTFDGGCGSGSAPGCYTSGDLICDTNSESSPNWGCNAGSSSCGSTDPVRNYMNYSDDTCMNQFTFEQAQRMRCSLANWRPLVYSTLFEPPTTYCTGKINSNFCVPFVSFVGAPSVTDSAPFRIIGNDIMPDEFGILVYGLNGPSSLGFHNGTLCVKAPLNRLLPPKASGSGGAGFCPGELRTNFNNRIQSGLDAALTVGRQVNAQWIYRDPGVDSFNDGLTDGIEFTVAP